MRIFLISLALFVSFFSMAKENKIKINSLEELKKCGETYSYDTGLCFDAFEKFVAKNPNKALEAAKLGRSIFVQWAVLPTFEKAYKKNKNLEICKDHDFQLSLFNSLGQPIDNDSFKIAIKFIKGACGPYLVEMAMKELDTYAGSVVIENLCPLLKANGKDHKTCEVKAIAEKVEEKIEKLPNLDRSKIKLGLIKAYKGPELSQLVIAEVIGEKNIYLIKFSNIKGPWNEKSILHKMNGLDNNGNADYWTEFNGSTWNSVAVRNCYNGYCQFNVFAPETGFQNGIGMRFDEALTKAINTNDILSSF